MRVGAGPAKVQIMQNVYEEVKTKVLESTECTDTHIKIKVAE